MTLSIECCLYPRFLPLEYTLIVAITWQSPASPVPLLISCTYHTFQRSSWGESDDSSKDFSVSPTPQTASSVQGKICYIQYGTSKNTSLLGRIFIIIFLVHVGCILGNYYGKPDEKVLIPGKTQMEIKTIEATSKTSRKLALKLLGLLFTKEELKEGLCTPCKGRTLLNQEYIEGIRSGQVHFQMLVYRVHKHGINLSLLETFLAILYINHMNAIQLIADLYADTM